MFRITTTGIEQAIAEAEAIEQALQTNIRRELEWFGKTSTEVMIATHTFQNRTYRLEGSIGYEVYPILGHIWRVAVKADAPYASQVEEGHPGPPPARPYPFFYPVFWSYQPPLWERLQAALDGALDPRRQLLAA